ncbi:MAG: AI-2E family transporter [Hydrogenophaga sp.]|jgi:predicted PurR-regulated permease PerM|uniref:AI-2E family transporter n=1 Tax=Hydrogenophaga sp. TaxID=1904254 RepID=UPI001D67841A|nr:AI-2E family transporter [Hydrogenophaga sp.]MBW0170842.1 AI-2E family transporter [Hydrogenophaga sp.]MBW0182293.1 AI-2E family transporter [Hydrogenophaga sp.]
MPLTSHQIRALLWAAIAVVIWLLFTLLAPVLMPFLLAAVLAYALHPLVERLRAKGVPRWLGAGMAISLLMLVLLAVFLLIVPVITKQVPLLREQVPDLLNRLNAWLTPLAGRLGVSLSVDVGLVREWLTRLVSGHEGEILDHLLSSLRIGGSALAAVVGNLFLMPIVAYYLLLDWNNLVERTKTLIPPRWRTSVQGFLDETDEVLGQYLRGQLLVMGLLAVFYAVALALVGLNLALPIGVFTGLAVFVPYLGFGVGLVLALLAALLEFQTVLGVALVAAVYGVGQVVESLYLTPRLLGERIGLHPIAVIFALLAFGHLFGFVGVLIALPASAVLLVAIRRLRQRYLASALYLEAPRAAPENTA